MTEPGDPPAYRHPVVYRTVRGLALSGSREVGGGVRTALPPPLRSSVTLRVQRGADLDVIDVDGTDHDDAAGLYDVRRYSEPND